MMQATRSDAATAQEGTRRDAGFMYVEILISMFILSMALLAVVPLFVTASHENGAARDLTVATAAAQDKVEELKTVDYISLAAGNDQVAEGDLTFQRAWTVQTDSPHAGMATITVTVTPDRTNTFGAARTASISFYRYD